MRPVAVIGAGPCGLAACKSLDEVGIEVECLEAREQVGGLWNVEDGEGGGYRSLETNTPSLGMDYSDFPFPEPTRTYRTAAEMVDYFRAYADRFGLLKRIRFGTRVVRARPIAGGGWRLDFARGDSRDYAALVVASGQYATPKRPHDEIPGTFSGEWLHVYDYLDASEPVDCRGRRVVVVGLGSSAAEVAAELADPDHPVGRAERVIVSARSGRWVLPKLSGDGGPDARAIHPATPLPRLMRSLPLPVGSWLMRRIVGRVLRAQTEKLGGFAELGLPVPTIEPWEDRPSLSAGFVPALREGRIEIRPGIDAFEGRRVRFSDGSSTEADVLLYATGYRLGFPFLDDETLGCAAPDLALYQRIAHPQHDGLFFVGCCRVMCSLWPLAEQQSRWVARALSGAFELPPARTRARKAIPLTRELPVMCGFYVEALRREAGPPGL